MKLFNSTLIAIGLISLSVISAQSQNIRSSNLTWEADEVTDLEVRDSVRYTCQFRTDGSSMEWIQKNGELKTVYQIVGVEGNWTDVSKNGTMTFSLERKERLCKMVLERTTSGVFVTLDFSGPGEYTSVKKFHIKSVQ